MDDTAMMREALRLAQEAADDGEVPVGCVVAMKTAGSSAAGETAGRRESLPLPTRSSRLSARLAGRLAAGGCGSVRCT